MNVHYHNWLNIEVLNSYFKEGMCPVIKLVPFSKTAKKLRDYDILIQKKKNLFSFHSAGPEPTSFDASSQFSNLNDLYFQLEIEDPLFSNYTDLSPIPPQQMYYFKNSENSTTLQAGENITAEDLVTVRQTILPISPPDDNNLVEIKNDQGVTIQKEPDSEKKYPSINPAYLASGNYQLWVNGQQIETFYHFDTVFSEKCVGVVHINVPQLINTTQETAKLTLQFKARFVYWQYQVVLPKLWSVTKKTVSLTVQNEEKFTTPSVEKQITGGQTASVFTSSTPLQLEESLSTYPQLSLTYIDSRVNRKADLLIDLPNPSAEQLKIINPEENENAFCSTTIIYV